MARQGCEPFLSSFVNLFTKEKGGKEEGGRREKIVVLGWVVRKRGKKERKVGVARTRCRFSYVSKEKLKTEERKRRVGKKEEGKERKGKKKCKGEVVAVPTPLLLSFSSFFG